MEQESKTLTIPMELAQAILNYLQERPFKEVAMLIQALIDCDKKDKE